MHKETDTKVFTAGLVTTGKNWKQPKCLSVGEYFIKKTVGYYTPVQKKNRELYALRWTDLQNMLKGGGGGWGGEARNLLF